MCRLFFFSSSSSLLAWWFFINCLSDSFHMLKPLQWTLWRWFVEAISILKQPRGSVFNIVVVNIKRCISVWRICNRVTCWLGNWEMRCVQMWYSVMWRSTGNKILLLRGRWRQAASFQLKIIIKYQLQGLYNFGRKTKKQTRLFSYF